MANYDHLACWQDTRWWWLSIVSVYFTELNIYWPTALPSFLHKCFSLITWTTHRGSQHGAQLHNTIDDPNVCTRESHMVKTSTRVRTRITQGENVKMCAQKTKNLHMVKTSKCVHPRVTHNWNIPMCAHENHRCFQFNLLILWLLLCTCNFEESRCERRAPGAHLHVWPC